MAMSSLLTSLPPLNRTMRTRLIMIGAVLGAVVALLITVAVSASDFSGAEDGGTFRLPANVTDEDVRYAFNAPVGTCLHWRAPDARDMHKVKCSQPHMFEVTEVVNISDDYAEGVPQPPQEEWAEVAEKRCTKGARVYLNKPLDPEGKFSVTAFWPNQEDWEGGNRRLRCGLWRMAGDSPQPTKGPAVRQNQSDVWPKGTCLALVDKGVGGPVRCADKHSYEMIALKNLAQRFDSYPSKGKQNGWLDKECEKAAKRYTGGRKLDKKLIIAWDTRSKDSWRAGSKLVNCKVGALLADKSGLAPITGSIAARPARKPSR